MLNAVGHRLSPTPDCTRWVVSLIGSVLARLCRQRFRGRVNALPHDRGVVLTHAMLMLAAGGAACSDIEFLASQPRLCGPVASDSTLYRTIRNITPTVLWAKLRPGNAGANTVTDHLTVVDAAIEQLPAQIAAGHHHGDDVGPVERGVQVRIDSAGCTHGFVHGCRARNIGFAVPNIDLHAGA